MKISSATIKILTKVITGDPIIKENLNSNLGIYKTGSEIVDFLNEFGIDDPYITGSRNEYVKEKLGLLNGTDQIKKIIEEVVDPIYGTEEKPIIEVVKFLDKFLRKDGYKFISSKETIAYNNPDHGFRNEYHTIKNYKIEKLNHGYSIVETSKIEALSHEFINQQIKKAKNKLQSDDYDGVITNIRSMIEAVQEELIRKNGLEIPEWSGDLNKLYKATKKCLNLDTDNKDLDDTLKQILSGLNNINCGIAGLSNKMSDRHSRKYKPSRHHARLAINTGLSFCEFLLDSYEYQSSKKKI